MELGPDKLLTEAEANALVNRLDGRVRQATGSRQAVAQLDQLIIMALLLSGLRNSEFCTLAVGNTIVGTGESVFIVRGRSLQSRTVYVPRHVSDLVWRYVNDVRPRSVPPGINPQDQAQPLVFNERRRPYERTGLYRRVVRILAEAGLGARASVQLLRHTYGYLAYLRTGGNLLFVQRQLGHSHPRITAVYARFVEESYADLAEQVSVAREPLNAPVEAGAYVQCIPEFNCEVD